MDIPASHHEPDQAAVVINRISEALAVAAGGWLLIAPYEIAMDFAADETALWSSLLVGAVAIFGGGLSILRLAPAAMCHGLVALAGVWAIIAPFILDFEGGSGGDAALTSIFTGIALTVLAFVGYTTRRAVEQ